MSHQLSVSAQCKYGTRTDLFVVTDGLLTADAGRPLVVLHAVPDLPGVAELHGLHVVVILGPPGLAKQRVLRPSSQLQLVALHEANLPHKLNRKHYQCQIVRISQMEIEEVETLIITLGKP